jgi:hypothetical protein
MSSFSPPTAFCLNFPYPRYCREIVCINIRDYLLYVLTQFTLLHASCLIGIMLRHTKMGQTVKQCAQEFPLLDMDAVLQPITRTVLRIKLYIRANFRYVSIIFFSICELCTEAICICQHVNLDTWVWQKVSEYAFYCVGRFWYCLLIILLVCYSAKSLRGIRLS